MDELLPNVLWTEPKSTSLEHANILQHCGNILNLRKPVYPKKKKHRLHKYEQHWRWISTGISKAAMFCPAISEKSLISLPAFQAICQPIHPSPELEIIYFRFLSIEWQCTMWTVWDFCMKNAVTVTTIISFSNPIFAGCKKVLQCDKKAGEYMQDLKRTWKSWFKSWTNSN